MLLQKNNALGKEDWAAFANLKNHIDEFRQRGEGEDKKAREVWENLQLMAKAAQKYSGTLENINFVEGLVGRVGVFLSPPCAVYSSFCSPPSMALAIKSL